MTDLVFVLAVTVPLGLALVVGVVMALMGIASEFRSMRMRPARVAEPALVTPSLRDGNESPTLAHQSLRTKEGER